MTVYLHGKDTKNSFEMSDSSIGLEGNCRPYIRFYTRTFSCKLCNSISLALLINVNNSVKVMMKMVVVRKVVAVVMMVVFLYLPRANEM